MERLDLTPRLNWREDCESVGFTYHSMDGVYWDEAHCYRFSAAQIDELEAATAALHELTLTAIEQIVTTDRFEQLAIPAAFADYVRASWRAKEPALAGRFDLAYDGVNPPKLLEYNADTPTALLEASVVQWRWLQQAVLPTTPEADHSSTSRTSAGRTRRGGSSTTKARSSTCCANCTHGSG